MYLIILYVYLIFDFTTNQYDVFCLWSRTSKEMFCPLCWSTSIRFRALCSTKGNLSDRTLIVNRCLWVSSCWWLNNLIGLDIGEGALFIVYVCRPFFEFRHLLSFLYRHPWTRHNSWGSQRSFCIQNRITERTRTLSSEFVGQAI